MKTNGMTLFQMRVEMETMRRMLSRPNMGGSVRRRIQAELQELEGVETWLMADPDDRDNEDRPTDPRTILNLSE